MFKEYHLANGFSAQGDSRLVFAMGKTKEEVSSVRVRIIWPDGKEQFFEKIKLNTYQIINQ
jgi:hypothetical protein